MFSRVLKSFMLAHIQNQILSQLLKSDTLRYSEVQLKHIDKDLFNYHLKFLVEKGYVLKTDRDYKLSDFGKKYVLRIDLIGEEKEYFKFSVLPYVTRVYKDELQILLHKRNRHPYRGDTGTISGKVKYGELVEVAAKRRLEEESGLTCENFKLVGVHRKFRYDKAHKLFEDTLYHCCFGENPSGELIDENDHGKNFWANFYDAIKFQSQNMTASQKTQEVLERVRDKNFDFFYFQEEIVLKGL